jgi:uncharacterized membrane protein
MSGIFEGFEKDNLLKLCEKENWIVSFIYAEGTFVLKGSPFLVITNVTSISKEWEDKIRVLTNIEDGETIETNFYYGFRQLKEVAVKALSPGINDPGTAILSLQALADLLVYRANHFPLTAFEDSDGIVRITVIEKTFDELLSEYFLPIWDYGKNDRSIRQEIRLILLQLREQVNNPLLNELLQEVETLENNGVTLKHEY